MQLTNHCLSISIAMKILAAPLALALAAALFGSPLSAAAGNKTATSGMQVSFVVKEACTVQTATSQPRATARAAANPANSATIDRPAAPIHTESGAQNWVVYF